MAEDEAFRRYVEAGMAWFSVTQQKAEGILRDLADSGGTAMGQAQQAFERIVDRGRQGSEELRELVRSEIRAQVAALGLATRDDIARLEAKLDAVQAAGSAPAPPGAAPAPPGASADAAGPPGAPADAATHATHATPATPATHAAPATAPVPAGPAEEA